MNFIRSLRPVNLFIIFLSYSLVFILLTDRLLIREDLLLNYQWILYITSLLSIVFSAASGNLINDFFDDEIDFINRKRTSFTQNTLSSKQGIKLYLVLVTISTIFSFTYSYISSDRSFFFIVLVCNLLLFFYSYRLKSSVLIGNVLIALFISLVVFLPLYLNWALIQEMSVSIKEKVILIVISFGIFTFLVNLVRELIKDVQDKLGDATGRMRTFAVRYGEKASRNVSILIMGLLLIAGIWWFVVSNGFHTTFTRIYFWSFIFTFASILTGNLFFIKSTRQFAKFSRILKYYMVSGLIYLILVITSI